MATQRKKAPDVTLPNGGGQAIGSSGLKQFGGYVFEEDVAALRGRNGIRVYRQMSDQDDTIGAIVFAITMLLRSIKWSTQPADETPEAEDAAAFLDEVIDDMAVSMADVMDEAASMFVYGHAPMEIVYKRRSGGDESKYSDNKIGVRGLFLRAQDTITRWVFDPSDDALLGMVQQPYSGTAVEIPVDRLVLFRTTRARNNPEGRSILRNAFRNWTYKRRLQEIEGIGVERDLAGLPVGKIPGRLFNRNRTPDEATVFAAWTEMVQKVRRDQTEGILIPSDRDDKGNPLFEFTLLSTGGTRSFDTGKIIDRYDRGMATSVLADFIFLGQQSVGSFALSSDKTALFATALGGFVASIEHTLNHGLVDRVWAINGMDEAVKPTLKAGDIEHDNVGEIASLLTAMAGAGAQLFPDRTLENRLREMAGLPPAPEGDDAMQFDARYPPPIDPSTGLPVGAQPAGQQQTDPQQDPSAE